MFDGNRARELSGALEKSRVAAAWKGRAPIAAVEAVHDKPVEKSRRSGTVGRGVAGELGFAEGELERAAVGQLVGIGEQLGIRGKESLHFSGGTEMEFALQALFGMVLPEQGEGADALDDVVLPAVGRGCVVDGEGGDRRNGLMD